MAKRLLRYGVGAAVIAAVAYFFVRALSDNWEAVQGLDLRPTGWTAAALILFVASVIATGLLWGGLISHLTARRWPRREAVRVQLASWLLRYVPGQVGSSVNKLVWASSRGIPTFKVVIAVVYEQAFQLLGALVPGIAVVLLIRASGGGEGLGNWLWIMLASLSMLLLVSLRPVLHPAVGLLTRRVLKRTVAAEEFLSFGSALRFQLAYFCPRILLGLATVAAAHGITPLSASEAVLVGAAYVVAGAIGVLAIFVPSGLGVRESAFVVLVVPLLPVEQAIVIAVTARLVSTVADGVCAVLYAWLRRSEGSSRPVPEAK